MNVEKLPWMNHFFLGHWTAFLLGKGLDFKFFALCAKVSNSKLPLSHDIITPMLHGWNGVLMLDHSIVFLSNQTVLLKIHLPTAHTSNRPLAYPHRLGQTSDRQQCSFWENKGFIFATLPCTWFLFNVCLVVDSSTMTSLTTDGFFVTSCNVICCSPGEIFPGWHFLRRVISVPFYICTSPASQWTGGD